MCIIMPVWSGKVNFKDRLVLDYSKFYKSNHLLLIIVSNPSCWYSFSLDVPFMVPVIAKAALY